MYCTKCGAKITNDAKYCFKCGESVSNTTKRTFNDNSSMLTNEIKKEKDVPFVTYTIIGLCVFISIMVYSKTGEFDPDPFDFIELGASSGPLIEKFQIWRLFSSAFLHAGIKHLVCNMLCLFSLGVLLERIVGHLRMFYVFMLSAVFSEVFSLIFHYEDISLGASGATFGVFGAGATYLMLLWKKDYFDTKIVFSHLKFGLLFVIINLAYSLLPGINMASHIGGLIVGSILGGILAMPILFANKFFSIFIHVIAGLIAFLLMLSSQFYLQDKYNDMLMNTIQESLTVSKERQE